MPDPDFQPTLVGPTITIRPIAPGDWAELFAAGSDPEIWKVHPVPDRHTEPGFRRFFDGALNSKMGFVFIDRASGRLIGSSRYYGYEPARGEIEIGWTFIVRSHWVGDENWRSQGAMTKIGGVKREGLLTRKLSGDQPYFIFEITKGRYQGGGRALVS